MSNYPIHEPIPVKGYKPQSQETIDAVNANKMNEEIILRILDRAQSDNTIDKRWLAIARTHIEQGFMALNRAIFNPERIKMPGD
jgi:hypothetical protein